MILELLDQLDAVMMRELIRSVNEGGGILDDPGYPIRTPEGKRIFAQLIAPQNREVLRTWFARYRGFSELNASFVCIRAELARATREKLS